MIWPGSDWYKIPCNQRSSCLSLIGPPCATCQPRSDRLALYDMNMIQLCDQIVPFQPLFLKLILYISVEYFRSPRILFKNFKNFKNCLSTICFFGFEIYRYFQFPTKGMTIKANTVLSHLSAKNKRQRRMYTFQLQKANKQNPKCIIVTFSQGFPFQWKRL